MLQVKASELEEVPGSLVNFGARFWRSEESGRGKSDKDRLCFESTESSARLSQYLFTPLERVLVVLSTTRYFLLSPHPLIILCLADGNTLCHKQSIRQETEGFCLLFSSQLTSKKGKHLLEGMM
jgi:hypothetical protein